MTRRRYTIRRSCFAPASALAHSWASRSKRRRSIRHTRSSSKRASHGRPATNARSRVQHASVQHMVPSAFRPHCIVPLFFVHVVDRYPPFSVRGVKSQIRTSCCTAGSLAARLATIVHVPWRKRRRHLRRQIAWAAPDAQMPTSFNDWYYAPSPNCRCRNVEMVASTAGAMSSRSNYQRHVCMCYPKPNVQSQIREPEKKKDRQRLPSQRDEQSNIKDTTGERGRERERGREKDRKRKVKQKSRHSCMIQSMCDPAPQIAQRQRRSVPVIRCLCPRCTRDP